MAKLRAPDGCPWDKEQTHTSILSCLVEETFEFLDAVERSDIPNMTEELGDLLLQVVFHSQMASESSQFNFDDVVHGISEKLVRRHPHVFGNTQVSTADGVQIQWDILKAKEKADKGMAESDSSLGEIPRHLPPLQKAGKIQKRAADVGFDWADWRGPIAKIREELDEFEVEVEALEKAENSETKTVAKARMQSEMGDILFAMVNLSRWLKVDAERALSETNHRFMRRFKAMEGLVKLEGKELKGMTLGEIDAYWEQVKRGET